MRFAPALPVVLCLIGLAAPAAAQDALLTPQSLLQGCEALVSNSPGGTDLQTGACAGSVDTALAIGQSQGRVCMPADSGVVSAARVVVNFIYEQAERRSQRFGLVALQALQTRWPCR
jgi:hypothetical protein